jgi:hypothetical protein
VDQRHKETYWHSRFLQAFKIWEDTREINLNPVVEDSWIWTWKTSGSFFSKSVDILFLLLFASYYMIYKFIASDQHQPRTEFYTYTKPDEGIELCALGVSLSDLVEVRCRFAIVAAAKLHFARYYRY